MYWIIFFVLGYLILSIQSIELNIARSCSKQWQSSRVSNAFVTFVIPSKARETLGRTLQSLFAQTNEKWLAIVIFDGLISNSLYLNESTNLPIFVNNIPNEAIYDGRVCFQYVPTLWRKSNCAGEIRNYGMHWSVTEWVGFVDDDDTVTPYYVQQLASHAVEYPSTAAVVFRMCRHDHLIPKPYSTSLRLNDVGISFAMKRYLYHRLNYSFVSSASEDFEFLDALYQDHIPILMSQHMTYRVKDCNQTHCHVNSTKTFLRRPINETTKHLLIPKCKARTIGLPNFVFNEATDLIFKRNIEGLKTALNHSLHSNCISESIPNTGPIHVIFGAREVPRSPYYIQVQLEQRNTHHFTQTYRDKLSNALQIWEFNSGQNGMEPLPGINAPLYFIPTMLTLPSQPVYFCPSIKTNRSTRPFLNSSNADNANSNRFTVYQFGVYYHCTRRGNEYVLTSTKHSSCYTRNHTHSDTNEYCWNTTSSTFNRSFVPRVNPGTICMEIVNRSTPIDALMFGLIQASFRNQRELLCDELNANGIVAYCLQGVYGALLNYLVCISKTVVVNHYFRDSALETHRIDPLLQIQKVVIAESSHSSALDAIYSTVIPIVEFGNILSVVKKVIGHYDEWLTSSNYYSVVADFMHKMGTNIDPLCFALSNIVQSLRTKYEILHRKPKPPGLQPMNQTYSKNATSVSNTSLSHV